MPETKMLNGLMQSNMLKGADAADDSGYDADGDDGADNYDDDECDDGDENGSDDEHEYVAGDNNNDDGVGDCDSWDEDA
jgi:hypothetical protein